MIGARQLYNIAVRFKELHRNVDEPFGGKFIYLFGDHQQLRRVCDTPLHRFDFKDPRIQLGIVLLRAFQEHI